MMPQPGRYCSTKTYLKGAALLSIGQLAAYGLSFVRNIILARLLTRADFGLAASLAMTVSLLELVSRMAFGIQIIQDRDGDSPQYQAVAHALQSFFGLCAALVVSLAAYPMARVFSVPQLTWAFALLALVPLARGAIHLDLMRFKRYFNYRPFVLMDVFSQCLATMAAWPLSIWLRDFRAVLLIMLGKEIFCVAISHFLADRPYRWAWSKEQVRQMLIFSWPLLLNGIVIFASQQGDQMIIGYAFSLSDLAAYSIAFTLSSTVYQIYAYVGSSLMLPGLSRLQNNPAKFKEQYRHCLNVSTLIGLLLLGPLIVAGEAIIQLLYGTKYTGAGTLLMVFATTVALRFFRWAPAVASMAKADTLNQLLGNIARSISFPIAFLVIFFGGKEMFMIASCGILGEMAAIGVTLFRVRQKFKISLGAHLPPLLFLSLWITTAIGINRLIGVGYSIWLGLVASGGLWLIGAISSLFFFPDMKFFLYNIMKKTK